MRKFLYVALYLIGGCFGPSRSAAAEPLPRLIDAPMASVCNDPAYKVAKEEAVRKGHPLFVYVGQPVAPVQWHMWYMTPVTVSVKEFPDAKAPCVVLGKPVPPYPAKATDLDRIADLPGNPDPGVVQVAYFHLKPGKPVVTAYTASWCGPCQAFHRDVLETAEVKAVADVVYVDASNGFPPGVSSVPTVTMPGRQPLVGYRPLREFLAWVRGQ